MPEPDQIVEVARTLIAEQEHVLRELRGPVSQAERAALDYFDGEVNVTLRAQLSYPRTLFDAGEALSGIQAELVLGELLGWWVSVDRFRNSDALTTFDEVVLPGFRDLQYPSYEVVEITVGSISFTAIRRRISANRKTVVSAGLVVGGLILASTTAPVSLPFLGLNFGVGNVLMASGSLTGLPWRGLVGTTDGGAASHGEEDSRGQLTLDLGIGH